MEKDGAIKGNNCVSKDKANLNKTIELEEKIKKEKEEKIKNNHHRMKFCETWLVNLLSKHPLKILVIIKEGKQSLQRNQILKKKQKKMQY